MNLGLNNFQYRSGDQHTFGDLKMHNHCVEYNGATERKRSNLVHKVFSLLQGGGVEFGK